MTEVNNNVNKETQKNASTSPAARRTSSTDKNRKHSKNLMMKRKQPQFGICFDVDGVLARGTFPFPEAVEGFKKLLDESGNIAVPVTFVTNALNRNVDKANQIGEWMGAQISPKMMVQAQGPLELFKEFHDKHCLIIGQGRIQDITTELGFKNICFLEDIVEHYPLLDMVNHENRRRLAKTQNVKDKEFPRVEAIVLLGEPKCWESSLQLIIDLLKTDGKPNRAPEAIPEKHLPVIACNMDLQFMDRAAMPRYGHGAYLLCLEELYKKVTGRPLVYTSLVGKPSETTMRFAEHCLTRHSRNLGFEEPLLRIYLIGDTPEVDIVGSNLYQRYIDRLRERQRTIDTEQVSTPKDQYANEVYDPELPESRQIPKGATFSKQTVNTVESLLVTTGVYKPGQAPEEEGDEKNYQGHRDFPRITELYKPTKQLKDVSDAIDYILDREQYFPSHNLLGQSS